MAADPEKDASPDANEDESEDTMAKKVIGKLVPISSAITFGAISGFCSGYACKKAGKVAAIAFGGLFVTFQLAAYAGYVEIKWSKVEKDFMRLIDFNKDGKFDKDDASYALTKTVKVLNNNMAATGAGFSGGFYFGFLKG